MAKQYRAVTPIRYGFINSAGEQEVVEIAANDVVEGLPNDVMKQLWDAGTLTQEDVPDAPKVTGTSTESDETAKTTEGGGSTSVSSGSGGE